MGEQWCHVVSQGANKKWNLPLQETVSAPDPFTFLKWWINRVFRSIGGFLVREVVSLFPLMEATVSFNDVFDSFAHFGSLLPVLLKVRKLYQQLTLGGTRTCTDVCYLPYNQEIEIPSIPQNNADQFLRSKNKIWWVYYTSCTYVICREYEHVDWPSLQSYEYSRLSSLGTLQSVPGAKERWEEAVFQGYSCTAYYSIYLQHLDGSPQACCSQAN